MERKNVNKSGLRKKHIKEVEKPSELSTSIHSNSQNNSHSITSVTKDGVIRCRFDMFIRLFDHVPSKFKDGQRTWCMRGDKFTADPPKMLINLLSHAEKKYKHEYRLIEIYDNTIPKNSTAYQENDRIIFRIFDKVIEKSHLYKYKEMFTDITLPGKFMLKK